jgi:hypothetical protein
MDSNYSISDIAAVTRDNNGMFGGEMGFFWIFALLLLPGLFGGGMWGNNRNGGEAVTESDLCNSMNFNNLENAVGRLGDQLNNAYMGVQNGISSLGYTTLQNFGQIQRDMCTSSAAITAAVNAAAAQSAQCCCETNRNIDAVRYENAISAAAINSNIDAKFAAMERSQFEQTIAAQQNQINQLYLSSQLCGVVRYPNAATFNAGNSIWSSGCC